MDTCVGGQAAPLEGDCGMASGDGDGLVLFYTQEIPPNKKKAQPQISEAGGALWAWLT